VALTALSYSAAAFRCGLLLKTGFVALIYLDLLLTLFAMQLGFSEMNPVMGRLLSRPSELLLAKVIAPPFIAWLVPGRLLLAAIAFMLAVTGWNISGLLTSA